jgi:putative copper export protein
VASPVILLAGLVMAVLLRPNVAALAEPHGELLSAQVAGFVVLMGLAVANKWQLGPALPAGAPKGAGRVCADRGRARITMAMACL